MSVGFFGLFESFYDERLGFFLILHVYIEMIILVLYSISMCTKLIYHVLNPLCVPQIICQWFILIFMLLDSICPYFVDFYILSNKGY